MRFSETVVSILLTAAAITVSGAQLPMAHSETCHRFYSASPAFITLNDLAIYTPEYDLVTSSGSKTRRVVYDTGRGLLEYLARFSGDRFNLLSRLKQLTGTDVVVDFGSGEGFFTQQLHTDSITFLKSIRKLVGSSINVYLGRLWKVRGDKLLPPDLAKKTYEFEAMGLTERDLERLYQEILNLREFTDRPDTQKPRVLAITYEMARKSPKQDRAEYWTGRLFETIPLSDIPNYKLGLSYIGVFAYTYNMTVALGKAIERMDVGGELVIAGSRAAIRNSSESPDQVISLAKERFSSTYKALSELEKVRVDQSFLDRNAYLVQLAHLSKGIQVTYDKKGEFFIIKKIADAVEIPETVYETSYTPNSPPPVHIFRFTGRMVRL